jgi:hypothetical protein
MLNSRRGGPGSHDPDCLLVGRQVALKKNHSSSTHAATANMSSLDGSSQGGGTTIRGQWRARHHDIGGIHGNPGTVESVTYRIQRIAESSNPSFPLSPPALSH